MTMMVTDTRQPGPATCCCYLFVSWPCSHVVIEIIAISSRHFSASDGCATDRHLERRKSDRPTNRSTSPKLHFAGRLDAVNIAPIQHPSNQTPFLSVALFYDFATLCSRFMHPGYGPAKLHHLGLLGLPWCQSDIPTYSLQAI